MPSSRWFWTVTVGTLLVVGAIALPASGFLTGHGPFGWGPHAGPHTPGWSSNNTSSRYVVTFTESGLPVGTPWSVTVVGFGGGGPGGNGSPVPLASSDPAWGFGRTHSSTNGTITFCLRNGSYRFSVPEAVNGSDVYAPAPSTGNFTVNGSSVSVPIVFSALALYSVSFVEQGLPAGTWWSVDLFGAVGTGGPSPWGPVPACVNLTTNSSNSTSIGFELPNGTYEYTVPNASGPSAVYVPSPGLGNVTVHGSAVTVDVSFATVPLYNVTFQETGLPLGTFWFVNLLNASTGSFGNGSTGASVSFEVPNGVYNFTVGTPCNFSGAYVATPAYGVVTVDGANVTVEIAFTVPTLYAVTFAETGLPSGVNWSVAVAPAYGFGFPCWGAGGWGYGEFNSSSNATIGFSLPNGTYGFFVANSSLGDVLYVPSPGLGNFTVHGTALTIDVTFTAVVLYNVTFEETGLPNGTFWSVAVSNASGVSGFNFSSGTSVGFELPNGTYNFSVGNASNCTAFFVPAPAAGSLTVDGSTVTVAVVFSEVSFYNVTVTETGLPNGTAWFVAIETNGTGWAFGVSTSSNVTLLLPNGTYDLDVGVAWVAGVPYLPTPAYETITVAGAAITIDVVYATA